MNVVVMKNLCGYKITLEYKIIRQCVVVVVASWIWDFVRARRASSQTSATLANRLADEFGLFLSVNLCVSSRG